MGNDEVERAGIRAVVGQEGGGTGNEGSFNFFLK